MIDPIAATQNFARLAEAGGRGTYGFYEALDYTSTPRSRRQECSRRSCLHGAPSGNVAGGSGECIARRRNDESFSTRSRSSKPTELIFAGTHTLATSWWRGPRAEEVFRGGAGSRHPPSGCAPLYESVRRDSADAAAFQRPVRRNADGGQAPVTAVGEILRSRGGAKTSLAIAGAPTHFFVTN